MKKHDKYPIFRKELNYFEA